MNGCSTFKQGVHIEKIAQALSTIIGAVVFQSYFNKIGHLLVCKQSKRGGSPNFFIRAL
jgi:hypothetical protein